MKEMQFSAVLLMTLIVLALLSYGIVGGEGSRRLLYSEILASFAYSVMQIYYSWLHLREVSRMELVLADYYDQDRSGLLRWMKFTIVIMSFTTVLVPLIIFSGGWFLACFAISLFVGIFYMWFCFVRYVITGASQHVEEAKRTIKQHPEWSVEAVADHCGISRSHFQRVFHDITGETPAQYSKN